MADTGSGQRHDRDLVLIPNNRVKLPETGIPSFTPSELSTLHSDDALNSTNRHSQDKSMAITPMEQTTGNPKEVAREKIDGDMLKRAIQVPLLLQQAKTNSNVQHAQAHKSDIIGQRYDRSVLILYGTETGNSEDAAKSVADMAERLHFRTRTAEMDLVNLKDLLRYTIVVFTIATTGQGDFPRNSRKFWKSLLRKRLAPNCLSQVSFTSFGLGDSSYMKFNWTARKLHKRLGQLGAQEVYPRGEGDEQHDDGINGTFLPWIVDFKKHLLLKYPLASGQVPIPDDILLPVKIRLQLLQPHDQLRAPESELGQLGGHKTNSLTKLSDGKLDPNSPIFDSTMNHTSRTPATTSINSDALDGGIDNYDEKIAQTAALNLGRTNITDPYKSSEDAFIVQLVSNKLMTSEGRAHEVREYTFNTLLQSQGDYAPGAALAIYPHNGAKEVQELIDLMDWNEVADLMSVIADVREERFDGADLVPAHLQHGFARGEWTLRRLLEERFDFMTIPRLSFLKVMKAKCENDDAQRERLGDLIKSFDDYLDYVYRPRRTILEVLKDFPAVKLNWEEAASVFSFIKPRQYSIASGGILKQLDPEARPEFNSKIQIIVSTIKYQTIIRQPRRGLCSNYLATLKEGTRLSVVLTKDTSFAREGTITPIAPSLMIATGTGIAPLRSILWEHASLPQPPSELVRHHLFYGSRNRDSDFHYANEWEKKELKVDVYTAFSRDGPKKVYVQDILRSHSDMVRSLLVDQKATIYICGNAGAMPKAVRAALVYALTGPNSDEKRDLEAEAFLKDMAYKGRYLMETW